MARILILDDEKETRDVIALLLQSEGHEVRLAQHGSEAIDLGFTFEPDLLITDWRLNNDYDGFEVDEAFRFHNPNVKSILITGYSLEQAARLPHSDRFFKIMSKPFRLKDLSSAVAKALAT